MTLFFNLKPGVALGDATNFINKSPAEIVPPTVRAELQGEAQTFSNTVTSLTILMALAVFVMYVILAILYESYVHPLTVLVDAANCAGRRAVDAGRVWSGGFALRVRRDVHADGHREEERDHDRRLCAPAG